MRFYEFEVGGLEVYNFEEAILQKLADSGTQVLSETEQENLADFKLFVADYITEPSRLTVGKSYYAISLCAQPFSKLLSIEYLNEKVKYDGRHGENYVFSSSDKKYHLPTYKENERQTMSMCTTVFEEANDVNQFFTVLMLSFSGKFNITRSIV